MWCEGKYSRSTALQLTRGGTGAPLGGNMNCSDAQSGVGTWEKNETSLPILNQTSLSEY